MHSFDVNYIDLFVEKPLNVRGKTINKVSCAKINIDNKYDVYLHHLENFHQFKLEEIINCIQPIFKKWNEGKIIDLLQLGMNQIDQNEIRKLENEFKFAIESILLQIHLSKEKITDTEIINNQLIKEKQDYFSDNISDNLKIKINPNMIFDQDILKILKSNKINTIRLDGNRQFELLDLLKFIRKLDDIILSKIEYIEDPFKNFFDVYTFFTLTHIPIALDENYIFYLENLANIPTEFPIIIKPSLFSISSIFQFISEHPNRKIIFSSSYEPDPILKVLRFLVYKSDNITQQANTHGLDSVKFKNFPI